MSSPTVEQLTQFIDDAFNLSELADLCMKLGVKFEDIPGATLRDKARELTQHMIRRGRLAELRAALAQERPGPYQEAFGPTPERRQISTSTPATRPDKARQTIPSWGWAVGMVLIALLVWAGVNILRQRGTAQQMTVVTRSSEDTEVTPEMVVAAPIRITAPVENSEVRRALTVQGELAGELCTGCQLYLFVHPVHAQPNYYYLQSDVQIDLSADSFTANGVVVGGETSADNNKQYEIWVALSADARPEAKLTAEEWQSFHKEAAAHVTVTRVEL